MPAGFLALFYDKLTGRSISFCRIFLTSVKKDVKEGQSGEGIPYQNTLSVFEHKVFDIEH